MLITNQIEVPQPLEAVWDFFGDIPQVAACLPGTNLTDQVGDDRYEGDVTIKAGPVKLEFAGSAEITARDEANRTITVDAAGADRKGRGQASLALTAKLASTALGTKVDISLDLTISGAAAQYGRGLVADVTAVLLDEFAVNMGGRLDAISKGIDPNSVAGAKPASGVSIALRAARMALVRVVRRFFMPYQPLPTGR
ncbi:MAG: SRPBCC family protein [Ilumatobacter sp.]|jgi:carbon monoxide dehydrogenase subunit G|nr:carbon monoxide dehydrogenase [Acidimicrobiia bacterium]